MRSNTRQGKTARNCANWPATYTQLRSGAPLKQISLAPFLSYADINTDLDHGLSDAGCKGRACWTEIAT